MQSCEMRNVLEASESASAQLGDGGKYGQAVTTLHLSLPIQESLSASSNRANAESGDDI